MWVTESLCNPQRDYSGVVSTPAVARTAAPAQQTARPDFDRNLELVLSFLNTIDVESGTDLLDSAEHWREWCRQRGMQEVTDRASVREIRDLMRASINERTPVLPRATASWPTRVTFHDGVPTLSGSDALGTVLTAAVHLVATEHWQRIKICPADDCRWAFYDRSRNRSRTWCSMQVCGNREKARSWRERHTTG